MVESLSIILWSVVAVIEQGQKVVGVWLAVTVPRVSTAVDRTRMEQDQLVAEREAFDMFAKRVAALDPDRHTARDEYESSPPATGEGVTTIVDSVGRSSRSTIDAESVSISVVREAYRETAMAVPHYEEEYGESIDENLTAELGPDVARALIEGDVLTQQIQAAILNQAQRASKQRRDLLSHVETEHESLVEARRRLRDLHETATTIEDDLYPRPVRELVQSWTRLEAATTDCKTRLRERQARIQREHETGTMSTWSFQEYLYQPFQWRHPVLNDGLETLKRIRRAKRETVRTIYNW